MSVVGIITALRMEASCVSSFRMPYNRIVRLAEGSVVWLSGMGDDAARSAATELLELGVTSLVSFGIAGALDPKLSSGDLILPESIHAGKIPQDDEEGLFSYPVSLEWRDRVEALLPPHLTIVGGTLTTSPGVLASAKAKLELGAVTGACAYDMESAAIAEVAAKYEAPFIAIRAITNPVDFSPPAELLHAIQPEGSIKILHLLSLLYQGSVDVATLLHLGKEIREARRTLATVIRKADKELGGDAAHSDCDMSLNVCKKAVYRVSPKKLLAQLESQGVYCFYNNNRSEVVLPLFICVYIDKKSEISKTR